MAIAAVAVAAVAVLAVRVLGIGNEINRHVDPLSRPAYPGSGIPRSELATLVDIPRETPGWVLRVARLEARSLQDERPDRLTVELGDRVVIKLEGRFVCGRCSRPYAAPSQRGTRVRMVLDPRSRRLETFALLQ